MTENKTPEVELTVEERQALDEKYITNLKNHVISYPSQRSISPMEKFLAAKNFYFVNSISKRLGYFLTRFNEYQGYELPEILQRLLSLEKNLQTHQNLIKSEFKKQFKIAEFELAVREITAVRFHIKKVIENFYQWNCMSLPKTFSDPFTKHYQINKPKGVILIVCDIYSPILSIFIPLVSAIASGNAVALYIDNYTPEFDNIRKISWDKILIPSVYFIQDPTLSPENLLKKYKFDFIYVSGKKRLCQHFHRLACQHNIEFHSDIMGISVAIVDWNAPVERVAQILTDLKLERAGQLRDSLDYIYVHEGIYREFLIHYKLTAYNFYSLFDNLKVQLGSNAYYANIFAERNYKKLKDIILKENAEKLENVPVFVDAKKIIQPVIIKNPSKGSDIFQYPIKGPIIPILTFTEIEEVIENLAQEDNVEHAYCFLTQILLKNEIQNKIDARNVYFNHTKWMIQNFHTNDAKPYGNAVGRVTGAAGLQLFSNQTKISSQWGPKLFDRYMRNPDTLIKKSGLITNKLALYSISKKIAFKNILMGAGIYGLWKYSKQSKNLFYNA